MSELIVPYVLAYITRQSPQGLEILLSKRSKMANFGSLQYALVGGKIDTQESPIQALIREVKEEIGCQVTLLTQDICHILYFKGDTRTCMALVFKVDLKDQDPFNMEPEKHESIAWYAFDQLPSPILERHAFIINAVRQGIFYAEWGFTR